MPQITLKPVLTEKTMRLAQKGQYTFKVGKTAAKPAIARAVEQAHKVKVVRVTAVRLKSQSRRTGKRRLQVWLEGGKKAVVTLQPGQTIAAFSPKKDKKQEKR
jgi:large subunit ribosomal protein L23